MINPKNEEIINIYQEKLEKNNICVLVRSIHLDDDICFNSDQREILYAIEDCFGEHVLSQYKESAWGKSLYINMRYVPLNPPFENIMQKYGDLIEHVHVSDENLNAPGLLADPTFLNKIRLIFSSLFSPVFLHIYLIAHLNQNLRYPLN